MSPHSPKNNDKKRQKPEFSGEFLDKNQSTEPTPATRVIKQRFMGVLSLGETIQVSAESDPKPNLFQESINHLVKEEKVLLDSGQKELKEAIRQLRHEITALARKTKDLSKAAKEVDQAAIQTTSQPSQYELSFIQRLKQFIVNFRKNMSQAASCLEMFTARKRKKNFFWSQVKSKQGGGQYLFSGEHSASRSAA